MKDIKMIIIILIFIIFIVLSIKLGGGWRKRVRFPRIRDCYPPTYVNDLVTELSHMKYDDFFEQTSSMFSIITDRVPGRDYRDVAEYFQEECRLQCKRSTMKLSFQRWFEKNYNKILSSTKDHTLLSIRNETISTMFSGDNRYYWCTEFPTDVALGFYHWVKRLIGNVDHILDMSSGRGARLAAAMVFGATYTGVDPNDCCHKKYGEMISYLSKILKRDPKNYKILNAQFEKISIDDLSDKKYDVMFTSPPYFDLEKYVHGRGSEKQSIAGRSVDEWVDEFMIVSMRKSADLLRTGGIIGLNLEDPASGRIKYIDKVREKMKLIDDLTYLGCGTFRSLTGHKNHPIWVWQKV